MLVQLLFVINIGTGFTSYTTSRTAYKFLNLLLVFSVIIHLKFSAFFDYVPNEIILVTANRQRVLWKIENISFSLLLHKSLHNFLLLIEIWCTYWNGWFKCFSFLILLVYVSGSYWELKVVKHTWLVKISIAFLKLVYMCKLNNLNVRLELFAFGWNMFCVSNSMNYFGRRGVRMVI